MAIIQITEDTLTLFEQRRLYHQPVEGRRWRVGANIGVAKGAIIEPYSHVFGGDRLPSAFGAFSYSHSGLREWLRVGRYVSIGPGVGWLDGDHPDEWATSSPIAFDLTSLRGMGAYFRDRGIAPVLRTYAQSTGETRIGHDVWIGHSALIARGVTIGTGAIVGARSLVLDDVPPYAVVFGAPAKVQRMRFEHEVVESLLASKWWTLAPETIQALPIENPAHFAELAAGQQDAARIRFKALTAAEIAGASTVLVPD